MLFQIQYNRGSCAFHSRIRQTDLQTHSGGNVAIPCTSGLKDGCMLGFVRFSWEAVLW